MAAKFIKIVFVLAVGGIPLMTLANANSPEKKSLATSMTPSTPAWQQLSPEQRRELLNSYQSLRQLDDKDKQDLQQRMDWFSQLPKDQQQRMREAWQNMSSTEREHWKNQLKTASADQRDQLREKILEKYD